MSRRDNKNCLRIMFQFISSLKSGFTYHLRNKEMVTSGIIVAYAETQDAFGLRGFVRAFVHASLYDGVLGGWEYEGRFYFDSCRVFADREKAIEFGRKNGQIAIFDLDNLEEIRL
jgi:hypothetical protein